MPRLLHFPESGSLKHWGHSLPSAPARAPTRTTHCDSWLHQAPSGWQPSESFGPKISWKGGYCSVEWGVVEKKGDWMAEASKRARLEYQQESGRAPALVWVWAARRRWTPPFSCPSVSV